MISLFNHGLNQESQLSLTNPRPVWYLPVRILQASHGLS